ncbi:MAG: hypothetical protein B1H02_00300 [Candidatus Latescibacteria bacterium 4484_107]|nr:MAG: hypothetical protein B1H02_00300 [Candidatus Latescibacteria bacterium 4484_107]
MKVGKWGRCSPPHFLSFANSADSAVRNGTYTISKAGDAAEVVIQGAGVEDGDGDGSTIQSPNDK